MPFDLSNDLIVVRPQDMLVARFYLIGCHRDNNEQFHIDSGASPLVVMRLPMQHLAEAVFVPAVASTTQHLAACESQIAYAINAVDLENKPATLEVLLSALSNAPVKTMTPKGFAALGLPDPDVTRSEVSEDPRTYFTALELPFRLTISPDVDPIKSVHPSGVSYLPSGQSRETVELWGTRLTGPPDSAITVRGLFTRESSITDVSQWSEQRLPGRALGHQGLIDLVVSNSQPDKQYAIDSDLLMLGPLGGNAHLSYSVDAPAPGVSSGLIGYKEFITIGQTEYLRVVKLGTLLPFGLRAHLITVNFRRCGHEDTAATTTPQDDAFIDEITYIEIVDSATTIADAPPFGSGQQKYCAPYREIRVAPANRRTPPINATTPASLAATYGGNIVVPYVLGSSTDVEHLFNVTLIGHDEVEHAVAMPMTFALATSSIASAAGEVVQDVATFMRSQVRNNLPNALTWVASHPVNVGELRLPTAAGASNILRCVVEGVTGGGEPVWTGDRVIDGTAQWIIAQRPTFADIMTSGAPMLFTLPSEIGAAKVENSVFPTFNIAMTLPDARADSALLLQPLQQMTAATIEHAALKAMGAAETMAFSYTQDYVQNGLSNAGAVFAQVTNAAVSVAFDQLPSKVALALPNMDVVGLSQAIGTVSGDASDIAGAIKTAQSALFDPQTTFKAAFKNALSGFPTLFGFSLADIISSAPLGFEQAPKISTSTKNINGVNVTHIGYQYSTSLTGRPPANAARDAKSSFSGATLDMAIGVDINDVNRDIKNINTRCTLKGPDAPLFYLLPDSPQLVGVTIRELTFSADSQKGTAVSLQGVKVAFAKDLAFVQELADSLGSFLGGGWTIAVTSDVAIATLSLHVPSLSFGAFALENMHIDSGLTLPFSAAGPSLFFNFASRQSPFHVQLSIFAGGGFIRVDASTNPGRIVVQGEIEFGGSLSFDLGPIASGCLYLMAGIYFLMNVGQDFTLQAYIRAGGALSILGGLLTASVEFYLALTYDGGSGELSGTCSISYEIHILFFSASVTVTMQQHIAGSKRSSNNAFSLGTSSTALSASDDSPTAQQMFPSQDDWRAFMKKFNFA